MFTKFQDDPYVQKREIALDEILEFLIGTRGFVIALIDVNKKATLPDAYGGGVLESARYFINSLLSSSAYAGHYILLVQADTDYVYYLNPSSSGLQKLTHGNFDVARKSRGTDEDLIFVFHS